MKELQTELALAAFTERNKARSAAADLRKQGFSPQSIGIASQPPDKAKKKNFSKPRRDHRSGLFLGMGSGALLGALTGTYMSLTIPGLSLDLAGASISGFAIGI